MNIKTTIATALLPAGALALVLSGCGAGGFSSRGLVEDCTGTLQSGGQVTVLDSSQNVIGTATLATDNSRAAQKLETDYASMAGLLQQFGGGSGLSVYRFSVAVPGGQSRYGIQAGNGHGTVWFSAKEMQSGPDLTLGC
jgi:hypothetical protein